MIDVKTLFDYTQTDKKGYTKILNSTVIRKKPSRNPVGKIVMMNPETFLKNSYAKTDVSKEALRNPHFKPGSFVTKWPLPYVDIMAKKGFGRGRALLCMHWKIKAIPVFVVGRNIADIDKWVKKVGGKDGKIDKEKNSRKTK